MYSFLIPLALAVVILVNHYKKRLLGYQKNVLNRLSGAPKSELYQEIKYWYERELLTYQKIDVDFEKAMKIKRRVFIISLILILLFKTTNMFFYSNLILNTTNYRSDTLSQIRVERLDPEEIQKEVELFHEYLKFTNADKVRLTSQDDLIFEIESFVRSSGEFQINPNVLATRIYYRVTDYYHYKHYNIPLYLFSSFLLSFSIEIYFYLGKLIGQSKAKGELRFLKRLVILYGSTKPVKFMDVLAKMKEKSRYHSQFFEKIYEANIRTSLNLKDVYSKLIREEKNLDVKLFLEKIDQANNYDFDQAIVNIKNEFRVDRKARDRQIKKQIQNIEIMGSMLIFILLTLMIAFYLLKPWLSNSPI